MKHIKKLGPRGFKGQCLADRLYITRVHSNSYEFTIISKLLLRGREPVYRLATHTINHKAHSTAVGLSASLAI